MFVLCKKAVVVVWTGKGLSPSLSQWACRRQSSLHSDPSDSVGRAFHLPFRRFISHDDHGPFQHTLSSTPLQI